MSKKFGKIVLLQGGKSAEREVSLNSAKLIAEALEPKCEELILFDPAERNMSELLTMKLEKIFVILHGGEGENGVCQAVLESYKIPFTGSRHEACVLAMNKHVSKSIWTEAGLATPLWCLVTDCEEETLDEVILNLGNTVFVKPNHGGSSLLSKIIENRDDLREIIKDILASGDDAIAEQLVSGIELTYAIINNKVLPGIRIEVAEDFYDYKAKYEVETTKFICPPNLPNNLDEQARKISLAAYKALGCSGYGRVDLMISGQDILLLEVNTVPGMTDHSLVPAAAKVDGIEYDQLVEMILEGAR